jgi:hypothetical protein
LIVLFNIKFIVRTDFIYLSLIYYYIAIDVYIPGDHFPVPPPIHELIINIITQLYTRELSEPWGKRIMSID